MYRRSGASCAARATPLNPITTAGSTSPWRYHCPCTSTRSAMLLCTHPRPARAERIGLANRSSSTTSRRCALVNLECCQGAADDMPPACRSKSVFANWALGGNPQVGEVEISTRLADSAGGVHGDSGWGTGVWSPHPTEARPPPECSRTALRAFPRALLRARGLPEEPVTNPLEHHNLNLAAIPARGTPWQVGQ